MVDIEKSTPEFVRRDGMIVDAAHFKSEYTYRPTDKNITKMGNLIRREFDKLR